MFDVFPRDVEFGVADEAFLFARRYFALNRCDFFLELAEDLGGINRVREDGGIEHLV